MLRRNWPVLVIILALLAAGGPPALYCYRKPVVWQELDSALSARDPERTFQAVKTWPSPLHRSPSDDAALLRMAAEWKHAKMARYLLEQGVHPDAPCHLHELHTVYPLNREDMTPLEIAAQNGDREIACILIDFGADVNRAGDLTPLEMAALQGDADMIRLLIARGADVSHGDSLTAMATLPQSLECLKLLLDHGLDVNAADASGHALLHWAANYLNTEGVRLLLRHGADASVKNDRGERPDNMLTYRRDDNVHDQMIRAQIKDLLERAEASQVTP